MGLLSRDISVTYEGHEIALSAALVGADLSTARYKLYIDGKLVDEEARSVWGMLFGTTITLRGRLPGPKREAKGHTVRVVANIRVFRNNDYLVFIDDEQIHHEWATYGGM